MKDVSTISAFIIIAFGLRYICVYFIQKWVYRKTYQFPRPFSMKSTDRFRVICKQNGKLLIHFEKSIPMWYLDQGKLMEHVRAGDQYRYMLEREGEHLFFIEVDLMPNRKIPVMKRKLMQIVLPK